MRFESWTTSSPSTSTGTRETNRARIRHPDLQGKGVANGLLGVLGSLCLAVRTRREALQATPGGSQGDAHPRYRPLEVERAVAGGGDD